MIKLIYGVGVNDRRYPVYVAGKPIKEYDVWRQVLVRCYDPKYQKKRPSYVGCLVSENFKNFSFFYEWAQKQIGFGQEDFHLDKDVLVKGNKLYSEDTCIFLPSKLNALFTNCKSARGSLPVGVSLHGNGFQAECCLDKGKLSRYIGRFKTPDLAFQAYKQAKETHIKLQAEKWKDQIDIRAYEALMRYEVLPTD